MRPLLLLTLILLVFGCSKKNSNKIPASLQAQLDSFKCNGMCSASVSEYKVKDGVFKTSTIFIFMAGGPACDGFPMYYDADGNRLNIPLDYPLSQFQQDAKLVNRVWKCQDLTH